ncbi:MAG: response regulator transcription factor [Bacteroidetes bacterium]|nr:response regulator transcription factor [Bacteroidota bacterium]MBK7969520.1 response regulator transcription factor [Bacteroidota bacterium]MBK9048484.1 response regulator transcription factor [Bacteroidota bacterium]
MQQQKYKLLVADDHRLFIEGIRHILQDEVYLDVCGTALNGKEAIEQCRHGAYDIVLMDVNMPLIDGIEATKEIKMVCKEVKIIIVSMLDNPSMVGKALKAGADAYVLKNSGPEDLIHAFKAVIKNITYITPSLAHLFGDAVNSDKSKTAYIRFSESIITERERQILKLISEGLTDGQIAETLFLSDRTVNTHRKNMLAKLKVPNTAALVKFAFDNKLI